MALKKIAHYTHEHDFKSMLGGRTNTTRRVGKPRHMVPSQCEKRFQQPLHTDNAGPFIYLIKK